MGETGHRIDVQGLLTTVSFDPDTDELVGHSPSPLALKDYIGNAAVARLMFEHVRLPHPSLLGRYGDIDDDGVYASPIENPGRDRRAGTARAGGPGRRDQGPADPLRQRHATDTIQECRARPSHPGLHSPRSSGHRAGFDKRDQPDAGRT